MKLLITFSFLFSVLALNAAEVSKETLFKTQIDLGDFCSARPQIGRGVYEVELFIENRKQAVATQTHYESSLEEWPKEYSEPPEEKSHFYRYCKMGAEFKGPEAILIVKKEGKIVAIKKSVTQLSANRILQLPPDKECPKELDLSSSNERGNFWVELKNIPVAVLKIAQNRELTFAPHSPNWIKGTVEKGAQEKYQVNWEFSQPNEKITAWKVIQFQHINPISEEDDYSLYCSGQVDLN